MEREYTISTYLRSRLEEVGLEKIFLPEHSENVQFLKYLLNSKQSPINFYTNINEVRRNFTADIYPGENRVFAIFLEDNATDMLDFVAGAYTDQLTFLLINCKKAINKSSSECNAEGHSKSRSQITHRASEISEFSPITAAAEFISDSDCDCAVQKIDSLLMALLQSHEPVYLQIEENMLAERCEAPRKQLPFDYQVSRRVMLSCERLSYDLAQTPSLSELARSVGTNRNTLTQEFHKAFDLSPFAWLREQRLQKAKALVVETDRPICRIGEVVGYSDSNHFSTSFRKRFGVSPRALRKSAQKAKNSITRIKHNMTQTKNYLHQTKVSFLEGC